VTGDESSPRNDTLPRPCSWTAPSAYWCIIKASHEPARARTPRRKHVRRYGATGVDDLVDQLGPEPGTREDAEAAVRLAVIAGCLELAWIRQ
jgi:hypothetical protein